MAESQSVVQPIIDELADSLDQRQALTTVFDRLLDEFEAARGQPQRVQEIISELRARRDELFDAVLQEDDLDESA